MIVTACCSAPATNLHAQGKLSSLKKWRGKAICLSQTADLLKLLLSNEFHFYFPYFPKKENKHCDHPCICADFLHLFLSFIVKLYGWMLHPTASYEHSLCFFYYHWILCLNSRSNRNIIKKE